MPGGRAGPHRISGVGFLAQQNYYNIFSVDSGPFILRPPYEGLPKAWWVPPANAFQSWTYFNPNLQTPPLPTVFRGPLRGLPEQPTQLLQPAAFQSWVALYSAIVRPFSQSDWPLPTAPYRADQTWAWSYNLNLIGQDRFPTGQHLYDIHDAPSPAADPGARRSWEWWYNLSLIGKDRMLAGKQVWELAPSQRPPEQIQLHSWTWSYNLNLRGQDQLPTGAQRYDLSPIWPPYINDLRTWAWEYDLNLIGQDRFPTGEQVWERPTLPIPPAAPAWAWQYNPNLIGQDFLPFRQRDWPLPISPQQPAVSWVDPVKIWLTTPVLQLTISQYWDRPQLPIPPAQSWSWSYNLNLIGQDRFPTGKQVWERPTLPIPPAVTWLEGPQYELIAKPFLQSDWPNPTQPYRIDQTWSFRQVGMIGQDQLATGEQRTELPDRGPLRAQDLLTWIQTVNLALTTTPAALNVTISKVFDRPILAVPPAQSWTSSYNLNLIGQDQLPFRQQDWPLTSAQGRAGDWIQQTALVLTAVQRPFVQSDWPLPQVPQGAIQTWINTIGLALTAKPFNQRDWPNPTQPARDPTLTTIAASYNLNLIGQDRLPNRQQDWPLPAPAPQPLLQVMVQGKPFFLVPPAILGLPLNASRLFDRPQLRQDSPADIAWPAWRWPQITPPPVSAVVPLRTLMGTGV